MEDKTGTIRHNLIAGLDPDGNVRAVKVNEDGELGSGGSGGAIDITTLTKEQTLQQVLEVLGVPGAEAITSLSRKIDALINKLDIIDANFYDKDNLLGNLSALNDYIGHINNPAAPDSNGNYTLASFVKRIAKLNEQTVTAEIILNAPSQEVELRDYPNLFDEGYAGATIIVRGSFAGVFEIIEKPLNINDTSSFLIESYSTELKAIGNVFNSTGIYFIQGNFKNLFIRTSPGFTGSAKLQIIYNKNPINTPDELAVSGILASLKNDLLGIHTTVAATATHTKNTPIVFSNFGFNAPNQSVHLESRNQSGENIREYACGTIIINNSTFTGSLILNANPPFQGNINPINPFLTIPLIEVSTGKVVTAIRVPGYYRFPGNLCNLVLQTSANFTGSISNVAVLFNQYKIYDVPSTQDLDILNTIKDRLMPAGANSTIFRNNGAISGVIKNAPGRILSISAINQSSNIRYLQFFDSNQAPTNNAPATDFYPLYALSNNQPGHLLLGQDVLGGEGDFYSTGIYYGISTTMRTFTAAAINDCQVKVRYL